MADSGPGVKVELERQAEELGDAVCVYVYVRECVSVCVFVSSFPFHNGSGRRYGLLFESNESLRNTEVAFGVHCQANEDTGETADSVREFAVTTDTAGPSNG